MVAGPLPLEQQVAEELSAAIEGSKSDNPIVVANSSLSCRRAAEAILTEVHLGVYGKVPGEDKRGYIQGLGDLIRKMEGYLVGEYGQNTVSFLNSINSTTRISAHHNRKNVGKTVTPKQIEITVDQVCNVYEVIIGKSLELPELEASDGAKDSYLMSSEELRASEPWDFIRLAYSATMKGSHMKAHSFLRNAIKLLHEAEDNEAEAAAYIALSVLATKRGDIDESNRLFKIADEKSQKTESPIVRAALLGNKSGAAIIEGKLEEAASFCHESLFISQAVGDKPAIANSLGTLGYIMELQENFEEAARLYNLSELTFRTILENTPVKAPDTDSAARIRVEVSDNFARTLNAQGRISNHMKDLPLAVSKFEEACGICEEMDYPHILVESLFELSKCLMARKEYGKAISNFERCLEKQDVWNSEDVAKTLWLLGFCNLLIGESKKSEDYFREYLLSCIQERVEVGEPFDFLDKYGYTDPYASWDFPPTGFVS